MAATFVAAMNGNGSPSASVTKNASVADNDFLIAVVYSTATLTTVPTGFAQIDTAHPASGQPATAYWKIASGEPSTWTWTAGSLQSVVVVMGAFRGTSTDASPIDVHSVSN